MDFDGTTRFEIVRRLGIGGMGVVYEAIDREQQTRVALKALRIQTADALLRFKNEFRALQDLQHPNLITFGELFEDRGTWFFTMELVRGESFLAWVGARPSAPEASPPGGVPELIVDEAEDEPTFDVEPVPGPAERARRRRSTGVADVARLRDAMGQLAQGLNALHRAHKVHRDIKPANVLVTAEGRVKILDFGLVIDPSHWRWPDAQLLGTVAYMAPEQCHSPAVGPEADWYAVGVMLYQALTGRPPFVGADVIERKQREEPPPPSALQPRVPADLDALCVELLRLEPGRRPRGSEVLRRLGLADPQGSGPVATEVFIGRARELDLLARAFFDSLTATVTVLVHGESGIGKSALLDRFVERVRGAFGATVYAGRCDARESVPFKAVDGVIDAICRRLSALPADEVAARLPADVALLGQAFAVMNRIDAIAKAPRPDPTELEPQELRRRVFATLRELLRKLCEREPGVLVIEDLQWADADSLLLLADVLRQPDAPPLLVIATLRDTLEGETGARGVGEIAAALPGDVRELGITSLPIEEARALVDALTAAGPTVGSGPTIDADVVTREASGHPMFIQELIRSRAALGAVRPLRLEDALWARIGLLDREARDLLELVAIAGGPLVQDVAARALAIEPGPFGERVARLRAAHLVRTSGARRTDWIEPYHDRVRSAVLVKLDPKAGPPWHQRLAQALESSSHADPEALASHWREAGDPARAAVFAARAAEDAARALAFDRAARLYRLALDLRGEPGATPSTIDRADVLRLSTRLGDALESCGRGPEAAAAYLSAAALAGTADAVELQRRAADQLLRSGHIDQGLDAIRSVLAAIGLALPGSPRTALASLLACRARVRLRGLGFRRREASAVAAADLLRIDTCWSVSAGLGLVDNIRGSYFQSRGLLFALAAGEPSRISRALSAEAAFSSAAGGPNAKRSARLLAEAERIAREVDTPYALAWSTGAGGIVAALEGRWSTALERCTAGLAGFRDRCVGVAWEVAIMNWFSLWSLAYLGKLDELMRRVPAQLLDAELRGDLHAEIGHSTGLANLIWLAVDDPDRAEARGRAAMARWSQTTFHVEHWWDLLGQTQVALYRGDGETALRQVDEAWPRLKSSLLLMVQLTRIEAMQLRGRAALQVARTADGAVRRRLLAQVEADARAIAKEKMPWATALAHLLAAGAAAVAGDTERARGRLIEAVAGLDAAGLALYGAAARARLGGLDDSDAGKAMVANALAWLTRQNVRRPERMIAMLAPGF